MIECSPLARRKHDRRTGPPDRRAGQPDRRREQDYLALAPIEQVAVILSVENQAVAAGCTARVREFLR